VKNIIFIVVLSFSFSIGAFAQNNPISESKTQPIPADFQSDGCSQFPDGDYADCCYEHDKAYFKGGSWTMRWRADKKLFKCVAAKKGFEHKLIAPVMWAGVRVFGVSFLPTSFRWGFGRVKKSQNKSSK
jgi:hypothetical protein